MQARAEEARIQALIYDPSSFKQANQAHLGDEAHAAHLLGLLPRAFLLAAAGRRTDVPDSPVVPTPRSSPRIMKNGLRTRWRARFLFDSL